MLSSDDVNKGPTAGAIAVRLVVMIGAIVKANALLRMTLASSRLKARGDSMLKLEDNDLVLATDSERSFYKNKLWLRRHQHQMLRLATVRGQEASNMVYDSKK